MVEETETGATFAPVPGPKKDRLSPEQTRKIDAAMRKVARAEKALAEAEREWALLVKEFGFSATWRLANERDPMGAPTLEGLRKRVLKALGEM